MKRKIIQVAIHSQQSGPEWNAFAEAVALCNDGTVWRRDLWKDADHDQWSRLPDIPQDAAEARRKGK
jgi:hypothetical protein